MDGTICQETPNLSVSQPAALDLLPSLGELLPELVDLLLRVAVDEQRNTLRELEGWTAVQSHELLAGEPERAYQERPFRAGAGIPGPGRAQDLRVREDGRVELDRFLRAVLEGQERRDFLQANLLSVRFRTISQKACKTQAAAGRSPSASLRAGSGWHRCCTKFQHPKISALMR
jgi:hypothetical protein